MPFELCLWIWCFILRLFNPDCRQMSNSYFSILSLVDYVKRHDIRCMRRNSKLIVQTIYPTNWRTHKRIEDTRQLFKAEQKGEGLVEAYCWRYLFSIIIYYLEERMMFIKFEVVLHSWATLSIKFTSKCGEKIMKKCVVGTEPPPLLID